MTTTSRPWAVARPGTHIPALDGLRGIALLLVLLAHFVEDGGIDPISTTDDVLYAIATRGWIGVDLFFVLSGFLITGILLDARGGAGYFRNFYLRRSLRIFPLYYAFLAIWLIAVPLVYTFPPTISRMDVSQAPVWLYVVNITQAMHGDISAAPAYTGHFWSLAVEEQFYLFWPAIVLICTRRQLAITSLGFIAAAPLIRIALALTGNPIAAYVLTPARMDALAVGALLALAVRAPGGIPFTIRTVRAVAVLSAAGFLALFWLPVPEQLFWAVFQMLAHSALAIGFGAVLMLAVADPGASMAARICTGSRLRFFGRYSYALYVVHPAVAYFIERYVFTVNAAPTVFGTRLFGQLLFIVIAGAVSVALALLSWYVLEKPCIALKAHFPYAPASARRAAPASATAEARADDPSHSTRDAA